MANGLRGEIELTGAGGTVYPLRLDTAAICALEQAIDSSVLALFEQLQKGGIRVHTLREFVKASAIPKTDDKGAAAIIDDVGILAVIEGMTNAIVSVFDAKAPKSGKANGAANPSQPARVRKTAGAGVLNTPPS